MATVVVATELAPLSAKHTTPDNLHLRPSNDEATRDQEDASGRTAPGEEEEAQPSPSTLRLVTTILQPSIINFLSSFTNGAITVSLPAIARALLLPRTLYLWPSSIYGLTSGSALLLAGSLADLLGARGVELASIFLLGVFTLGCGLVGSGEQLVVFRAMQGVAMAMHLPASVAIVAKGVPRGRARNIGFACLGLSQPLGFSVGLVVSGVLVERIGWRSAFYLAGGAILVAAVAAVWMLPAVKPERPAGLGVAGLLGLIYREIDWVGGLLAGGGLAMLSYVLAILSADLSAIHEVTTGVLLALSIVLLVAFPLWMHLRERQGKPALVPNSLWNNMAFSSVCAMVTLASGTTNAIELFSSLYFQEIQHASELTTSLYLFPNLLVGVLCNLTMGIFVDRLPARWLVTIACIINTASPMMMAVVNPEWNYFYLEFWAQIFAPISVDILFTIGLIIVSDSFPEKTQALAGAVFNTVSQFGWSLGIGICQVVALGVAGGGAASEGEGPVDEVETDPDALLRGYRASFWTIFAMLVVCGLVAVTGLRKTGRVGVKRE